MATHVPLSHIRTARHAVGTDVAEARLAGILFVLIGAAFLTVTMLAASMAPGYNFAGGAISDLGVIPETALLFNSLLVGIGILNLAGGYLLDRSARRPWLLAVFVAAGVGAIGAAAFPLDRGGLHSIFALAAFVFFNLEAIATAGLFRGAMRGIGTTAGVIGLAYLVVMVIGDSGNPAIFGAIGHGGAERLIAYPAMLWMLVLGGALGGGGAPREPR